MKKEIKIKKNGGAAMMIVVFFFMFISLTILIGIITPVVREFKVASDNFYSKQSYFIAESGVEDMMYRIKNNMEVGTIGEERKLFLNNSYVPIPTSLTDLGGGKKEITSTGVVNSNERKIDLTLTTTTGVSFNYGVQAGQGGVYLDSGTINGNVYSNGPITASTSGSNLISGTAISANSPNSVFDQSNGTGTPAYDISFGKSNTTQDIGQSFKVFTSNTLNKIQLYIKKSGDASNAMVKIMDNSNNKPGSNVLATGVLLSSSVSTDYGWINISFDKNPTLTAGNIYWLVIDAGTDKNKYYIIGATNGGYVNGLGIIGQLDGTWASTTPSGLDYYFNIYLGGESGLISGADQNNKLNIGTVSGSAQAHTVMNVNSHSGNIYCQTGSSNSKTCIKQEDPVYIAFPVSDANIEKWKEDAKSGGTYTGNYDVDWRGATIGPKKIIGNLTVSGGGVLVITGPLWVTGNIALNGGGVIKVATNYGSNDGVIIADGLVDISGGGHATGSGVEGSYIMIVSLSNSTNAISVSGGAGAVIVYAPNGTVNVSGGASLKEATGNTLKIIGGASITYESGLTNNNFSSGPSGSWGIDAWKEAE